MRSLSSPLAVHDDGNTAFLNLTQSATNGQTIFARQHPDPSTIRLWVLTTQRLVHLGGVCPAFTAYPCSWVTLEQRPARRASSSTTRILDCGWGFPLASAMGNSLSGLPVKTHTLTAAQGKTRRWICGSHRYFRVDRRDTGQPYARTEQCALHST